MAGDDRGVERLEPGVLQDKGVGPGREHRHSPVVVEPERNDTSGREAGPKLANSAERRVPRQLGVDEDDVRAGLAGAEQAILASGGEGADLDAWHDPE